MADKVEIEQGSLAKTAYQMAMYIWGQSNKPGPNLDNKREFLALVAECTDALKGYRPS